jgi:uncharacterized protein (DUF362 family)
VRSCLAGAGLDVERFGKPSWNPLGTYIRPGDRVFVLCNFVEEARPFTSSHVIAKCTHGSVVRAVIDYILKALNGSGSVTFGNAPIQSCDWCKVVKETGADEVVRFFRQLHPNGVEVKLADLRQHVVQGTLLGARKLVHHSEEAAAIVPVDLGRSSLLEALQQGASQTPRFRVLNYDPLRTEACHGPGRHVYLMSRQVLASDVVVSIPKLKTHEKVGITCALKGCVGAVAHKDCLAHHRYGPPSEGGDEYPDGYFALKLISALHEKAYTLRPGLLRNVLAPLDEYSRKVARRFTRTLSGGWPGYDTCWRMALDLATIVSYADTDGVMHATPRRKHLALTDGITAGEGDGPLSPRPVDFGYLSFSDNIAIADYINSLAMGFDPNKIPLIREALLPRDRPMTDSSPAASDVRLNGERISMGELAARFPGQFRPPREWRAILSRSPSGGSLP